MAASVVAAVVAAVAVAFALSRNQPALTYGPVGIASDPYRYVDRPVGSREAPPPTGARGASPAEGGLNRDGLSLATPELPAQVALFLPPRSLRGPSHFRVSVSPQGPVDVGPDHRVAGNLYVVRVLSGDESAQLTPEFDLALLRLRGPTADPAGEVWFRPLGGTSWTSVRSSVLSGDLYGGEFAGPGSYAVVVPVDRSDDSLMLGLAMVGASGLASLAVSLRRGRRRRER